jgi:hypothetical protein
LKKRKCNPNLKKVKLSKEKAMPIHRTMDPTKANTDHPKRLGPDLTQSEWLDVLERTDQNIAVRRHFEEVAEMTDAQFAEHKAEMYHPEEVAKRERAVEMMVNEIKARHR